MLKPDEFFDSIHKIPYDDLYQKGYRGIIFDIDNTLTAFDAPDPPKESVELINNLKLMGYKLYLLTNNTNKRLSSFNKTLQLPGTAMALKPLAWGIRKAMKSMSTEKCSTMIIGDQLLSDIWAGRRAGIKSLMVRPITEKDFSFVQIKRIIERKLMKRYFESLK